MVKTSIRYVSHDRATHDPLFLFSGWQACALYMLLLYLVAPLVMGLSWITIAALLMVCVLMMAFATNFVIERRRDRAIEKRQSTDSIHDSDVAVKLEGRPAQLERVVRATSTRCSRPTCFRAGLHSSQVWVLFVVVIIVIPLLRVAAGMTPRDLSLVAIGVAFTIALQYWWNYWCLIVRDGYLTIKRGGPTRVREQETLELENAIIECNFRKDSLSIRTSKGSIDIAMYDFIRPHALVSAIIAAAQASTQEPEDDT